MAREGRRWLCGALSSILGGVSYAASAEISSVQGPFPRYKHNKDNMLRVMRNHRRAAYNAPSEEYEGLTVTPRGIDPNYCPEYLLSAAQKCWDQVVTEGEKHGFRNAQATVIAPTGTIGIVMDCDTTGIEPDFALVKFKTLAGGGMLRIINQSVPVALDRLGYDSVQSKEIVDYVIGTGTFSGAPGINRESLKRKGLTDDIIDSLESQISSFTSVGLLVTPSMVGTDFCVEKLRVKEEFVDNWNFDLLEHLGYTNEQINEANDYIFGRLTIEGAPHIKDSDLAEDISQETFLRVWKRRSDLVPEKSFFSLIARISTNLCYDHFRHSAVRKRHEDQIPEYGKSHFDDPEKMNQAKMLEEEIQRIVNEKLPDKCKALARIMSQGADVLASAMQWKFLCTLLTACCCSFFLRAGRAQKTRHRLRSLFFQHCSKVPKFVFFASPPHQNQLKPCPDFPLP